MSSLADLVYGQQYPQPQPTGLAALVQPELRSYQPTMRDRLAQMLMGDTRPSPEKRSFIQGLLGSSGLGNTGMGLVDFTPAGIPMQVQEASREGDYQGAALAMAPFGVGVKGRKMMEAAAPMTIPPASNSRIRLDTLLRSEAGAANATKSFLDGPPKISSAPVAVAITPDGKPYLVDGYHRVESAIRKGEKEIDFEPVDFEKIKILYDNETSFLPMASQQ